jgi:hypothetical protein
VTVTDKPIETHRGRAVIASSAKLTNTGDGLSRAMRIDPQSFNEGDRVAIIVEAIVTKHGYEMAIKGDYAGPYEIKTEFKAESMFVTDNATVNKLLEKHKAKLAKFNEIEGQRSIDDETGDGDEDGAGE